MINQQFAVYDKLNNRYVEHVARYSRPRSYGFAEERDTPQPIALFGEVHLARRALSSVKKQLKYIKDQAVKDPQRYQNWHLPYQLESDLVVVRVEVANLFEV